MRRGVARALGAASVVLLVWLPAGVGDADPSAPHVVLRSEQAIPIEFNQGIARIPGGWILSGTNSPFPGTDVLARTDERFNVVATVPAPIPPAWRAQGYEHTGDIDVVGNTIYVPFEDSDYTKDRQAMARYDVHTLLFIDATTVKQHENSFVAVDPATMIAYTMDHFDGSALLRYDVAHAWKPLPPLPMSMLLHSTQGASVADGYVWISTSDPTNDLFRVSLATGHVDLIGHHGHPGGEGEGIDASSLPSGFLHTMIIDHSQLDVWIEHFDVVASGAGASPAAAGGAAGATSASGRAAGTSLPATGSRVRAWVAFGALALGAALVAARRRVGRGDMAGR